MKPEEELERDLEELGRSMAPDASIADKVMRRIEERPDRPRRIRRARELKWLVAAAAAVLLTVQLWPGTAGNGIVWADVLTRIRSARTAHLRIKMNDPQAFGGVPCTLDWYLRTPGMMRQEYHIDGVEPRTAVFSDGKGIMLIPSRKLAYRLPPWETASVDEDAIEKALNQFLPFSSGRTPQQAGPIQGVVGGEVGKLVLAGTERRDGRKLNKYVIESETKQEQEPSTPGSGQARRELGAW